MTMFHWYQKCRFSGIHVGRLMLSSYYVVIAIFCTCPIPHPRMGDLFKASICGSLMATVQFPTSPQYVNKRVGWGMAVTSLPIYGLAVNSKRTPPLHVAAAAAAGKSTAQNVSVVTGGWVQPRASLLLYFRYTDCITPMFSFFFFNIMKNRKPSGDLLPPKEGLCQKQFYKFHLSTVFYDSTIVS